MEKSKASMDEILNLGKKIVEELQLEPSVNTLGRWMAHYVAELIHQAESCESKTEKEAIQKECFNVILRLWKNRDHLPSISTPIGELKPLTDVLKLFVESKYSLPYLRGLGNISNDGSWKHFIETVKRSSEIIYELSVFSQVSSKMLNASQDWLNEHKSLLEKEEIEMIENLESLVNKNNYYFETHDKKKEKIVFEKLLPQQRYNTIFNRIDEEILEIEKSLKELKVSLSKKKNY